MDNTITIIIPASLPMAILFGASIWCALRGAADIVDAGSHLRGFDKIIYQFIIMVLCGLIAGLMPLILPMIVPEVAQYPDEFDKFYLALRIVAAISFVPLFISVYNLEDHI